MKKTIGFIYTVIVSLFLVITLSESVAADSGYKKGKGIVLEDTLPLEAQKLNIGDNAPDFNLLGVDGKYYSLSDFRAAKVLLVVFLSNHCPYSHAIEGRLIKLFERYKRDGLAVVAINPNNPEAVRLDELGYTKYTDSYEDMILYAKDNGFTFPYLYDGEKQTTAMLFGALATPHVFIFDSDRRLRYKGRFDDSRYPDPGSVTSPDAQHAVEALVKGKDVMVPLTRPMGCSTKWITKREDVSAFENKWLSTPVDLENINSEEIRTLVRNDSNRIRLINIWATWCAPCVNEFPRLVELSQRFANRDFELITISIDDPKSGDQVYSFLQRHHAVPSNRLSRLLKKDGRKSTNFLYSGQQLDDLVAALDTKWPGPVPYTIIVRPGGDIVFRKSGELNFEQLTSHLIEELGEYYSN